MDRVVVSVFENVFEQEDAPMSHVTIIGKAHSGKTELIKQMIGSFLRSGKRIVWFDNKNQAEDMREKWKGYRVTRKEEMTNETFTSYKFILLETTDIDFEKLRTILMEDENEWILVHDDIDELVADYEQNNFVTQKLDFLYFLSEFGRVFSLYTLMAGEDIKTLYHVLPIKKMIENSRNLLLLEQDYSSLKNIKKQKWLNEEQIEKVKNLSKYEALFLRK